MTLPTSIPGLSFGSPVQAPSSAAAHASAEPTTFAIGWLLANAPPSLQYRALTHVAQYKPTEFSLARVPFGSKLGWRLLMMQESDGSWPGGWLTVPQGAELVGVGTIVAYRRLIELGWDPECPALATTKRALFRLLAEDNDPVLLGELGALATDDELIKRGRLILREAAAAALAQAGYEADPRLRGAARRLLDRVGAYLKSPVVLKPWLRLGNQHVLAAEASAPSFHTLLMLAHMPQFRSEHHEVMDRLYTFVTQPWPRQQAVQQVGAHLVEQPHLVLGDFLPTRNVMDADMPSSLAWLEIMARLGFLKKHEGWQRLFERLLDDRDRKGVWHPPRSVVMPAQVPNWSWPVMPLSERDGPVDAASIDVTFRLGLIARLSGRAIDLI